jgi:hypothetical protein
MADDHGNRRYERLSGIAGDWATSGHVVGDPPVPGSGSDVYEVLPCTHCRSVIESSAITVQEGRGSAARAGR